MLCVTACFIGAMKYGSPIIQHAQELQILESMLEIKNGHPHPKDDALKLSLSGCE